MCIDMQDNRQNVFLSTGSTVVQKFGEKLDLSNVDAVTEQCSRFFKDDKIQTIVFDLENVRYCDSYGLKFLIYSQRKAIAEKKQLLLFRPDTIILEMFSATRLLNFFTIVEE
jgi:anti-anti-sigma factor